VSGRFVQDDFGRPERLVHTFTVKGYDVLGSHRDTTASRDTLSEACAWCADQFGPKDGQRWAYHIGLRSIILRDELDAAAFKLVWV
jgi:hypothetical protein